MDNQEGKERLKPTIPQIRKYLEANPLLLEDIKNMLTYRDLRSEQAYYIALQNKVKNHDFSCKLVRNAGEFEQSYWAHRLVRLDEDRRLYHNKSLMSFCKLAKEHERIWKLSPIYFGRLLTPDEIVRYDSSKYDIRCEMTDAMFEFLGIIEDGVVLEKEKNPSLIDLKKKMDRFNDDYDIKESMKKDEHESKSIDDLGMEFRFDSIINGTNPNENV